ncbi:MAG: hypothetical protein OEQ39_15380 [Gammaproteobacteria bacterium]|nr:hypothetical protein [Gammaproteobacteria bacterium]
MKQADVAGTAGLAALAVCDALIKELHRKNVITTDETQAILDTAMREVEEKGDKGELAARLISHMRDIFQ